MIRSYRAWLAFGLAFAWFSVRASNAWLASGYVDPVGRFGTQDEAFYTRVVIEMLRSGNWLTPTLLGRLAYFKPPLLYWLSALSVSIFGVSHYAFRLPSVFAGAGICALAFHWVDRRSGVYAAVLTLLLLTADNYMIMLSSVNMMDTLAAFCGFLALWTLSLDARLERLPSLWICAVALAGGILTKSVAGLVPAVAIIVSWIVMGRDRPRSSRVLLLGGLSTAFAAPWFTYSLLAHARWFWTEHVLTEILSSATGAGPLSTTDPNIVFYAQRLFIGDPVTAVVGLVGVGVGLLRQRTDVIIMTWLAISALTLLVFRQHAATYLLPLVIAISILSGIALPKVDRRAGIIALVVLFICATTYLSKASPIVWSKTNNPQARALIDYCKLQRVNSLFLIEPQDEFYSVLLPISRVQYGMIDQGRTAIRQPIDWRWLGVIVSAEQFANRGYWWPVFRQRLSGYGLNANLDPRATTVLLPGDVADGNLIESHPELDFYAPESWSSVRGDHDLWSPRDGRVWLLSRETGIRERMQIGGSDWACRL